MNERGSGLAHPQYRSFAFYGGMLLAGATGAALAGLPSLFTAPGEGRGVASVGLALALVAVVVLGGRALERFGWYARMADFLAKVVPLLLGPGGGLAGVLLLALESSLGEEALFRGFAQPWLIRLLADRAHVSAELAPALGVLGATLLFSAVHPPLHPDLRPWTVFALLIGLAFGGLAAWSGSLAAPVLAHFLIKLLEPVAALATSTGRRRTGSFLTMKPRRTYTSRDLSPMSFEEYGRHVATLVAKIRAHCRTESTAFDALAPILRSGGIPGSMLAIQLEISALVPLQLKYRGQPPRIEPVIEPILIETLPPAPRILVCENNTSTGETAVTAAKLLRARYPTARLSYATVCRVFGGPAELQHRPRSPSALTEFPGYERGFVGVLTDEHFLAAPEDLERFAVRPGVPLFPWEVAEHELRELNQT